MTSLTGVRRGKSNTPFDADASAADFVNLNIRKETNSEFSQEFNLSSNSNSPLQWLIGGFYLDNKRTFYQNAIIPVAGLDLTLTYDPYRTKSYAAFGQASYELGSGFSITLGARYSHEKNSDFETSQLSLLTPPVAFPLEVIDETKSFNSFTPKVTLQWKATSDLNFYATYARGFKAGGFNAGLFDTAPFAPEKVTNYEIGLKSMLFDRKVMFNVAAFLMDYSDLQVTTIFALPSGIPAVRVINAAKARIKGVEADFRATLGSGFSVDGNASYLHAVYTSFPAASDGIGPSTFPFDVPIGAITRDATGNRMTNTPEFSTNLGLEYEAALGGSWRSSARAEYGYQSRIYYTPFENLRNTSQKAVGTINGRLSFRNTESGLSLALWGRNLTNKRIISTTTEVSASQGIFRQTTYRSPRTYGVTVGIGF
ncbi:hypothetical protein ASE00_08715 [Sphingomonas sp. Root710]|nr:hypothetical protein ASE00_08715 [Sphingomonas sp. Root710]